MCIVRLLLVCSFAVTVAGCFSNYAPDDASNTSATLHFLRYEGPGTTFFNAVSDPLCTTNQGRLATMDVVRSASQAIRVPAEKRLFVVGQWINGFGSHCLPSSYIPGKINVCTDRCTVVGSFVPKIGSSYKVDMEVSANTCNFVVTNLDSASQSVPISTYPATSRCRKVF